MKKIVLLFLLFLSVIIISPSNALAQEETQESTAQTEENGDGSASINTTSIAKAMWMDQKFDKWFLATIGFTASPGAMNQNGPYGILFGTDIWRFLAWEIALDFSFRSLSITDPMTNAKNDSTLLPISIKPFILIQPKISISRVNLHIFPYLGIGGAMTIKVNIGGNSGVKMDEVGNFVGGVPIKLGCRFQWKKLFAGLNLEYTWIYNNAKDAKSVSGQMNDISGFSVAAQIGAIF